MSVKSRYGAKDIPVNSYFVLMGAYVATFASLHYLATRDNRELRKPKGLDLALLTLASGKLSRIITMSFIGSPIRAPFTKRGPSLRGGEVQDVARGEGLQQAIGNLLTCPFCFSVWSTTAFVFGYSLAPKATLAASYILSIAAMDDVVHYGYRNLRETSL